jgi:hypothetical protein
MDIHPHRRIAPHPRSASGRTLFAYSLWFRAVIIGLLLSVGGAASVAEGAPNALAALAAILGGAALAAYSWQRAAAALARLDAPTGVNEATSPAHPRAHRVRAGASADAIRSRGALAARQA